MAVELTVFSSSSRLVEEGIIPLSDECYLFGGESV